MHALQISGLSSETGTVSCFGFVQMLDFGMEHPGSYMKSKQEGLKDHGKHYPSSNYNDEMAWGALWLYFATGVRSCASVFIEICPLSGSCWMGESMRLRYKKYQSMVCSCLWVACSMHMMLLFDEQIGARRRTASCRRRPCTTTS
jgi:hypothetical protein